MMKALRFLTGPEGAEMNRPARRPSAVPVRCGGVVLLGLLLGACQLPAQRPDQFLAVRGITPPAPQAFRVCAEVGCKRRSALAYTSGEWRRVARLFEADPGSARQERRQVARAVALIETLVGAKNGTAGDRPRNEGWFVGTPQLDCVAETVNTTVALELLERGGLLRYHRVGYPVHRGFLNLTGPHYSAVLIDRQDGQGYVVDSWFFENGHEPVIVTVERWKAGYEPAS